MEKFDNNMTRAPERISQEEAEKICQNIEDDRLSCDEDVEHFVIKTSGKRIFVPKRKKLNIKSEEGFRSIKIEDYLMETLRQLSVVDKDRLEVDR